jgi:hypothetical protein
MPLLAPVIRHVFTVLFSKIYYLMGLLPSKLSIIGIQAKNLKAKASFMFSII